MNEQEAGREHQSMGEVRTPQGLLYVEVDCPPELEGEFHGWYNTEHVPERLRIPGFITGRRYAALEGAPRWVAAYELETVAVLESPEYLRWAGPLQTAWTKRMVSCTRVHRSIFSLARRADSSVNFEHVHSLTGLLAIRYEALSARREALNRWHDIEFCHELLLVPGVRSASRYDNVEGEEQLILYTLEDPWVVQEPAFARLWAAGWESRMESLPVYRRTLGVRIL
jgi:hypothetical protein